jgi:hypothetical protein
MKMWSKRSLNKKTCKPFLAIICVLQTLPVVDVQLVFALSKQRRLPASVVCLHQVPVGGCA